MKLHTIFSTLLFKRFKSIQSHKLIAQTKFEKINSNEKKLPKSFKFA